MTERSPAPPNTVHPKERKWLPVVGILALLAFVTLGGVLFLTGDLDALGGSTQPGQPIEVAPGISIVPLEGWQVGETVGPNHLLRLIKGNGFLDAFAIPGGTAAEVYLAYMNGVLLPQASQLDFQTEPEPIALSSGLQAVRGAYQGTFEGVAAPIEGEVTGIVTGLGSGIAFDGWTQQGQYGFVAEEVRRMVESVGAS